MVRQQNRYFLAVCLTMQLRVIMQLGNLMIFKLRFLLDRTPRVQSAYRPRVFRSWRVSA